jgi:hypothetical protein
VVELLPSMHMYEAGLDLTLTMGCGGGSVLTASKKSTEEKDN